ncbi:hypothetical protein ABZP36_021781 [Zizania latifolia]
MSYDRVTTFEDSEKESEYGYVRKVPSSPLLSPALDHLDPLVSLSSVISHVSLESGPVVVADGMGGAAIEENVKLFVLRVIQLQFKAVERAANADGQKITYSVIKHRLGDLFCRLVCQKFEGPAEGEDVLVAKFQKLYDDLTTGFRNLEDEASRI